MTRLANCSTRYAGKVIHELFVKSSTGGRLGIPTVPLSDFYAGMARRLESLGGVVKLRTSVEGLAQGGDGRWVARTTAGEYYGGCGGGWRCLMSRRRSCCLGLDDESCACGSWRRRLQRFVHLRLLRFCFGMTARYRGWIMRGCWIRRLSGSFTSRGYGGIRRRRGVMLSW